MSDFDYRATPGRLAALQEGLSTNRVGRYLSLAGGDLELGLKLYAWNTAMSESLYGPLQGLEVLTRNRFHDRLSARYGANWYEALELDYGLTQKLSDAKKKLTKARKVVSPPSVIAELAFGFWVGLLGSSPQQEVWITEIHKLYKSRIGKNSRRQVHSDYLSLRNLRNRIAHHECIITPELPAQYELIESMMKTLSPDAAAWMQHFSRFNACWFDPINPWAPRPRTAP